ncbi:MAG: hypothetical protein JHC33_12145 [Ignisphaera sp.]|nr:hypothetical protein [Ignisphaera sp.]
MARKQFAKSTTGKFLQATSVEESMDSVMTASILDILGEGTKGYLSVAALGGVAILAGLAYGVQAMKSTDTTTTP